MEQTINIEELVQDDHNLNKGTQEGQRLMERSFRELGAGRSILVDKDGRIIAGNKSQKAAMAAGIRKVRVIETEGDELIAVKRTDLSLDSKEGRELAYADNLTTQVNLAWDEIELDHLQTEVEGFDTSDWGFDAKQLAGLEPIVPKDAGEDVNPDDFGDEFSLKAGDKPPYCQMSFTLADAQADFIKEALKAIQGTEAYKHMETFGNSNSNGNALYLIVKQWEEQKKSL